MISTATMEKAAVPAVVLVGAVLRFSVIDAKPLWLDEAFSIWVANLAMADLIKFVGSVDHHPPLYYILLHYWQIAFGDGAGTVRWLSALLGTATIPLFYLGGRILAGRRSAWFAALLLAVSPFHVRYGQEARMYALMTFLAAVMLWCLAVYLADSVSGTGRRRLAMTGLAVTEIALLFTHNTAVLLLPVALNAGVIIPWLWTRRDYDRSFPTLNEDGFMWRWLTLQAVVILAWTLWLPRFLHQAETVLEEFWIEPLTGYFVWLTFHNFNLAFPDGWMPGSPWWDILYWGLAIVGLYTLRRRISVAFLLATLFIVPAVLEIVISIQRPILYDRTLIWTTLPYYMLVGCGVGWVSAALYPQQPAVGDENAIGVVNWKWLLSGVTILLVLVALPVYSLTAYYRQYEKEDWPAVAAYLRASAGQGDLVLFNAPWGQIPYDYYAGLDPTMAELRGMPVNLFDRGELESKMSETDLPYLRGLASEHGDVWLVYTHEWYTDPDGLILAELAQRYDLIEETAFNGPRVLHFSRSSVGD